MIQPRTRLASIDILRAFIMFLMIFVNDLWTLENIPRWLEHTEAGFDGMGLADIVFPAFLFIVGLSIPLALDRRAEKGCSNRDTILYILSRSLALITMGFFHVNLETYSDEAIISKPYWQISITIAFFLIWLDYGKDISTFKIIILRSSGILLLTGMALLYSGNDGWMKPQWWGILGLIGWSYLLCALIYQFFRARLFGLVLCFVFFLILNMVSQSSTGDLFNNVKKYVWIPGDGSMPALTMAGVIMTVLFYRISSRNRYILLLGIIGLLSIAAGFYFRQFWIISKIRSTPPWVSLCVGITTILFALMIWLIDIRKSGSYFKMIKPAGTSSLTCYLIPYIHYALLSLVPVSIPVVLRTGWVGVGKSLLYSLIIISLVGWMEKHRLRLKV